MPDDMGIGVTKNKNEKMKPIGVYVFTDVNARGVLRDIFLDGNTFRESIHTIDKENFVARVSGGLVIQIYNVKIGYVVSSTSPEFDGQKGNDLNGTFMIVYSRKF